MRPIAKAQNNITARPTPDTLFIEAHQIEDCLEAMVDDAPDGEWHFEALDLMQAHMITARQAEDIKNRTRRSIYRTSPFWTGQCVEPVIVSGTPRQWLKQHVLRAYLAARLLFASLSVANCLHDDYSRCIAIAEAIKTYSDNMARISSETYQLIVSVDLARTSAYMDNLWNKRTPVAHVSPEKKVACNV
jgi:hypothetical protein